MTGPYSRSCHVTICNMHKTWGLIYSHTMRTMFMSCHMLLHVQRCHTCIVWCTHAGKLATLCKHGPKLLMDMPFMLAELYLRKFSNPHFSTLNMKISNQNVLKGILIAMHNENKADCNEKKGADYFKRCRITDSRVDRWPTDMPSPWLRGQGQLSNSIGQIQAAAPG